MDGVRAVVDYEISKMGAGALVGLTDFWVWFGRHFRYFEAPE